MYDSNECGTLCCELLPTDSNILQEGAASSFALIQVWAPFYPLRTYLHPPTPFPRKTTQIYLPLCHPAQNPGLLDNVEIWFLLVGKLFRLRSFLKRAFSFHSNPQLPVNSLPRKSAFFLKHVGDSPWGRRVGHN